MLNIIDGKALYGRGALTPWVKPNQSCPYSSLGVCVCVNFDIML